MIDYLRLLRPKQWIKNVLIWAPVFFAQRALNPSLLLKVLLATVAFIMTSSAVYIINDIIDYEKDKHHPTKKNRAIASGKVSKGKGLILFAVLFLAALFISHLISVEFLYLMVFYVGIQILYSFWLKQIVLVDVFIISFGFVLRILAGGIAATVDISSWILLCTLLGSLFLALSKRRNEIIVLEGNASSHREALNHYSVKLLDHLISIVAGATILAYALYTQDHDTILKFGTDSLIYTIPFVIYGLFRYLYLTHMKEQGGDPSEVFLYDTPTMINIILFIAVVSYILY